ncbi:glycosyltransferase [Fictibacillus norfolkensis]|uniref:Glycosyltransferase n=1 Tax=Fictibacillus norfolkensis TaxID=2762233 RepID=A0ABR8SI41_9BACL|nr:glycosyltransferase [Fictibacillus norfolkensis]MBD7963168.1 glycosyltransferase [Fictibacillus norfolkensis]
MNSIDRDRGNKQLVILSSRFPFPPGEEFLETEIKYLSNQFETVHIIPVNIHDYSMEARETPRNTEVLNLTPSPSSLKKTDLMKKLLKDPQGRRWFLRECKYFIPNYTSAMLKVANWIGLAVQIRNQLSKILKDRQYNLSETVFYSYWLGPSATALAMLKEFKPSIKVISRAHGGDLYAYRHSTPYMPAQKETVCKLDKVFVISQDGSDYLKEAYPESSEKIGVSRLGTRAAEGKSISSSDGILRIVSCSNMLPVKRLDLIIDTLKRCKQQIYWSHIGDGPLREELEMKVQEELPTNIQCEFLGRKKNAEVLKYYQTQPVDLFINLSSSEGIPVSIMEAYSYGIPSFATDVGGTKELVHSSNGMLIEKNFNPEVLAREIDQFALLSEEERENYRSAAYEKWKEFFFSETNYSQFAKLLREFEGI